MSEQIEAIDEEREDRRPRRPRYGYVHDDDVTPDILVSIAGFANTLTEIVQVDIPAATQP